ncbi:MAG TPA: disulfide bond formation protein B [Aquihabitans sp.]|jgi:disulfide bond formation protein DsbB|nr:disulfide bond formation protein B [Aquihabitans sp.]
MDTDTVTLFFALLAVAAQAAVVVVVVLAVGRRWSPALARAHRRVVEEVGPQALGLAAAVAAVCTGGSLYLSEVAGFPPCRLCWYQRAAMYPLALVLAVAAWRRLHRLRPLVAAVAVVGGAVSIYHLLVERYPSLETTSCDPDNPCSIIWVERFGYLTIPAMALSGFALIVALVALARPSAQEAP